MPPLFRYLLKITLLVLVITGACHGLGQSAQAEDNSPYPASLALQGFSGILNTPSAFVLPEGTLHLMYSDQVDTRWRNTAGFWQENYHVAVGLFDFAEISGRLISTPYSMISGGVRDMSASVKLSTATFTRDIPWLPALAVGIQDVGGGATFLQSKYAVASMDLWRFRLSAGYGFGPDRMKGAFGGAELVLFDWMRLLGEYDTHDTNVGVRLTSPPLPLVPVSLMFTAKSTVSHKPGNIEIAAGISIPLDVREWNRSVGHNAVTQQREKSQPENQSVPAGQSARSVVTNQQEVRQKTAPVQQISEPVTKVVTRQTADLDKVQRELEKAGFINLKLGQRGDKELVVQYENIQYMYNELDALGLVAGLVCRAAPEKFDTVTLVVVRKGIAMTAISAPRLILQEYLNSETGSGRQELRELRTLLTITNDPQLDDVMIMQSTSTGWVPPVQLTLAPGLKTHVGSEIGVFDYLLSLRPEVTVNPWQGGLLNARWDLPVAWSKNYNTNEPFSFQRQKPEMDRLQFTQAFKLLPSLMLNIGGGMLDHSWYGTLNELIWQPGDGRHRVHIVQSWASGEKSAKDKSLYLGSYRYNFPELDLSLEGTGGRYWNQDEGFSAELKRFFGDVAVSVYYKNVSTLENRHIQTAGLQLSLPFTTRKNIKLGPVTVGGTDEWSYAQESQIVAKGQANYTNPYTVGATLQNSTSLERSYENRDRLYAAYISSHLERIRDAWLRFSPQHQE
jgi:hypothetical protein